ncbi:MAG: peptidoglycan DL-endopeptidase CwlO [Microbacteriaceae bacterium]|nr:peptidoglycan DL-endopeptidase CwlO [Microbacteriaceae bacterium]
MTLGAVTAAFTITPAVADEPTYPSWQDVQQARQNTAAAKAEVDRITTLLTGLQAAADKAGRDAQIAAEHAHTAQAGQAAAQQRHAELVSEADAASTRARTSRMRAGLLASHLARSTGGDLPVDLLLNGSGAKDLLYQLATMSQLSSTSEAIYRTALADENTAKSLGAQADVAAAELQQRADAAAAALASAQRSSAAAASAVAEQQRHANQLLSQLANLQHTTTRVAASYVAGVQHKKDEAAAAAAAAAAETKAPRTGSGSSSGSSNSSGSGSSTGSGSPSGSGSSSSGSGSSSTGSGSSSSGSAGAPNSAQAASAVAFARDQIGDRYQFAGAGPSDWDCSGLTMQAYASVGIGIGGHSATAQYDVARSRGQLVSYSQVAVGDLIFYTDGGGDMYHVAIYSGSGMMIEAPYDGVPVREVPVRSYQRMPVVARPTA